MRESHFKNRFQNKKLREVHKGLPYAGYVEGIIGYLGDIACAIYLGIEPLENLFKMVASTDCLSHRDESDLRFRMCNLDVKVEDFGKFHEKVVNGEIGESEPYGCRLINKNQWIENSHHIDYYVFATTDRPLSKGYTLDKVRGIYLLGFIPKGELEDEKKYPFQKITPAGGRLHTPAKVIPNKNLKDIRELKKISPCYSRIAEGKCRKIVEEIFQVFKSSPSRP